MKPVRIPKKQEETAAERRTRILKETFLKERAEFAEILYNKAVTYMANAVKRKRDLNCMENELLNKINEVLKNVSIKCKEMANIYQSILNSYDEQSQALDRIFTILKK